MNPQHRYGLIFLPLAPGGLIWLLALALCLPAAAQESGKDSIQAAFNRNQLQAPQEKLFVHIDRSFYLAGETIWFRIYDIDAGTNRPTPLSGIAYVEVLDRADRPVLQAKIELQNGKGDGAFSIPLSIPSGEFVFRAYTSWMKNFSPDFYYMQPLTIFNTLNDTTTDTGRSFFPSDTAEARLRVFPEGGNLVNGLTSTVAIETVDRHGTGIACEGAIIGQHKDTVAHFQTNPSGIGRFTFTPTAGNTYSAVTKIDQTTVTRPLPEGFDRGYVMHLEDNGDRIHIVVHAAGPIQNPAIFLFAHTRGQIKAAQVNFLSAGQTSFSLNKDSLGEGISHITVFNGDRIPVCERLYFRQPKQRLHIGVAGILPDNPTRAALSVNLTLTDKAGNPLAADLSMSVFRLDSLQSVPTDNMLTWLLLTSDLPKINTNPSTANIFITATNASTAAALDDLMLTQGWSRFRWEDILKDHQPEFDFLPETNGAVVNAKIIDRNTGQPPAPLIAWLSLPGRHFQLATARSRPDGALYFHLGNFYGARTFIAQTNPQTDSNCRLDIVSPWSERFASPRLPAIEYSTGWSNQLLQRTIDVQAENAYLSGPRHLFSPITEDTIAFYGTADLKYNLDDYVRFVTMEEVIQEFVDNVKVRRRSGHAFFRVRNALFNLFFEDDPLLLIDGIPVFNADKLLATDPAKIEKIDVVSHRYVLGPAIADGVVSFRSYDGEFGGYELDPNAVAVQYNGLDRHREFYTPVYTASSKGLPSIPDFRNELLWVPGIIVDTTGKATLPLYTSDVKGKFALVVQGITEDGIAGYSMVTFSVGR